MFSARPVLADDVTTTISAPAAPSVTSTASTTFTVGSYGTFTVTTTGEPTPSLSDGGATLPSGVTFTDNGDDTATIAGTPAPGSGGVYDFTITAGNGVSPGATQDFTLTVDEAPSITSADSIIFLVNEFGTVTLTTSGYPTPSLSIDSCLNGWFTFGDNGNGTATVTGTPLGTGPFDCVITASNGVSPEATQNFTLYVGQAPVFISVPSADFVVNQSDVFTVTTQGCPPVASLSGSGVLPSGVTFTDNGDGTATLAGTAAAGTDGTYDITITAHNGVSPDGVQDFTLTVGEAAAPAITSDDGTTFTVGSSASFTVTSSGFPNASVSDNGAALPDGVTLTDNGDGTATLAGAPSTGTAGDYEFTITARNGTSPDATQDFTLTVDAASTTASLISSANPAVVGEAVTLTATVVVTPSSSVTPTGTVGFLEGTVPLSGCADQPIADDGTATCTLSFAAVGDPDVVAAYDGNASFVGSASNDLDQAVDQAATTVTVTSSPNPATVGQAVTITVTVKAVAPGGGNPTGSVTVDVDGTPFATLTLDSSVDSEAVLTTNALAAGTHSITASYAGDTDYSASTISDTDTQPVTSTPSVPLTGGATGSSLGIVPGILLILAGLSVLAWRRRTVTS